ncbi:MAG TPA: DUF47 family protein [Actinomycetota bacterium]|nr:DUF47 family protein [Actinomycetota bacterium]
MRLRLIPREESFFELFEALAQKVFAGSNALLDLLQSFTDVSRKVATLVDLEHEGDEIVHEIMRRLNTTFVTPFDREDISRLGSQLDDVLDHVEATAEFLELHKIDQPLPQMVALAETLRKAAKATAEAMPKLRELRGLSDYTVEVNRLENEGDRAYRRTIAMLFSGEYKAMDVLKWKDIIEEIEAAIDTLEDVANTVEDIVLKQT